MRDRLAAGGLDEVISLPADQPGHAGAHGAARRRKRAPPGDGNGQTRTWRYLAYDPARPLIALANPLSQEQEIMRPSCCPSCWQTLRANLRHDPRIAIFEVSHVYRTPSGGAGRAPARRRLAPTRAGRWRGRGRSAGRAACAWPGC